MYINGVLFNAELSDILETLRSVPQIRNRELLQIMRDSGDDIMIQCPYHNDGHEKRPSAGIRKSDGIFHCFACNETHSLPEVISFCFDRRDDILGKFGWTWLLKNFASVQVEERKDVYLDFERYSRSDNVRNRRNNNTGFDFDKHNNKDQTMVSEEELDKYRYKHPYMYKRGLTDEVILLFDIGYDADSDCITFPVRDECGHCLFVARRSVRTKYFSYPRGVEKPLYGLYEITKYFDSFSKDHSNALVLDFDLDINSTRPIGVNFPNEVIVCESMLDALSFWVIGKYAVALNGLGSELQFQQLRKLPCRKLILATDNDEAGAKARKRIRDNVKNKLITEYIFPDGRKDANECTREELMNLEEIF